MGHSRRGAGHPARLGMGLGAATRTTVLALLASIPAIARPSHDQPIYKDPNAPVEQRVEDLLSRMTLEEKIAQITCIWNRKQEILTPSGDFDAARASQTGVSGRHWPGRATQRYSR